MLNNVIPLTSARQRYKYIISFSSITYNFYINILYYKLCIKVLCYYVRIHIYYVRYLTLHEGGRSVAVLLCLRIELSDFVILFCRLCLDSFIVDTTFQILCDDAQNCSRVSVLRCERHNRSPTGIMDAIYLCPQIRNYVKVLWQQIKLDNISPTHS